MSYSLCVLFALYIYALCCCCLFIYILQLFEKEKLHACVQCNNTKQKYPHSDFNLHFVDCRWRKTCSFISLKCWFMDFAHFKESVYSVVESCVLDLSLYHYPTASINPCCLITSLSHLVPPCLHLSFSVPFLPKLWCEERSRLLFFNTFFSFSYFVFQCAYHSSRQGVWWGW